MNRQVSYNWLKEYVKLNVSAEQFAREFSLKSQTVDRVTDLSQSFSKVITAQITKIEKHPQADKLQLATVTVGHQTLTVVCGAPNIAVGQVVALAPVGAMVQDTEHPGTLWPVKKATIRNIESNGMLCSTRELGLGDDHTGILVLPANTPLGKPLMSVLPLNDSLLDIEITSNRPDAMSVVGLAREAAAVFNLPFAYQRPKPDLKIAKKLPLEIKIKEPKLCARYQGVVMTDVTVGPSPLWLQLRLMLAGLRPINNVVDITNYVLLESGKPLHVFDYDKINGAEIIVRKAKPGESLLALDGVTYRLTADHLVIADAKAPIAIGGVMGGEASAATSATKTIVFESAVFEPLAIRRTARALNVHSRSSDLFEKGLSPESVPAALLRAIELTQQLANGRVASPIVDVNHNSYRPTTVPFDPLSVEQYLGVAISPAQIKTRLTQLGFSVASRAKGMQVTVPWWRDGDVAASHDLVEEVARIYGYPNLPTTIPAGPIPARATDHRFSWQDRIKDLLVGAGFSEVYNYSMVPASLIEVAGDATNDAIEIANPLSEDLKYLRRSLLPQLLKNVADNLGAVSVQHLFELSNIYELSKRHELPHELPRLAGVVVGSADVFPQTKGTVEFLLKQLGIGDYELAAGPAPAKYWQPGEVLAVIVGKTAIGHCGMVNRRTLNQLGVNKPVGAFMFDVSALTAAASAVAVYRPIPEFPAIERDVAIVIDQSVHWQRVHDLVSNIDPLVTSVDYLSTFTNQQLGVGKKSLAFRVVIRAGDRTLKSEDADVIIQKIIKKLEGSLGAKLR